MDDVPLLDFDLALDLAGATAADGFEARVLDSPAGQTATLRFANPFQPLELENYLLKLGHNRGLVRSGAADDRSEVARALGGRLYAAVFAGDVGECLRRSLDRADSRGAGLRLRLRLPGGTPLADLPWEFLYDAETDRFLGLSDRTPIVRYIGLPDTVGRAAVDGPLRMLVVIASPSDLPALDVEREWGCVRQALAIPEASGRIVVDRLEPPTMLALQRACQREEYHIVHFVGHGGVRSDGEGVLMLADAQGRAQAVPGRDLGALLFDERTLRLLVLNSCEGARGDLTDPFAGTAQALVRQGVPAVVAMQFEISDEAAIVFAQSFYEALASEWPVDAAMSAGRRSLFAASRTEWATPVLYLRAPDGAIFSAVRPAEPAAAAGGPPAGAPPVDGAAGPDASAVDEGEPSARAGGVVGQVVDGAVDAAVDGVGDVVVRRTRLLARKGAKAAIGAVAAALATAGVGFAAGAFGGDDDPPDPTPTGTAAVTASGLGPAGTWLAGVDTPVDEWALPIPRSAEPMGEDVLAFGRNNGLGDTGAAVFAVATDGSGDQRLSPDHDGYVLPVMANDRRTVVYYSRADQAVYAVAPQATDPMPLVAGPADVDPSCTTTGRPALAPDRPVLALWCRSGSSDSPTSRLVLLDLVTGDRRVLYAAKGASIDDGTFRPDGQVIAFWQAAAATPDDRGLVGVEVATGRARQLTEGAPYRDADPAYSPDGRRLAFVRFDFDDRTRSIWTMPAGGGKAVRLTSGANDEDPTWSPDGTRIAFTTNRDDGDTDEDIWVMAADGDDLQPMFANVGEEKGPAWTRR